ncbi:PaaI family thioesterase [Lentibacter sp. XHP0401]|uniref:PaaI family thioesterase n=1 Tax=Lentibacter sp. XHP0401 TaxID=2984334 RepID=UPI0021E7AABE|nr:PaaI family thioesterase [Lentibacter sp. XHP0401]MCV2891840.1 PaaI family thioesterase [Lentibacter sp. XHP0401]
MKTYGDYEARVRESFARQKMMGQLKVVLLEVRAGEVVFEMPFQDAFTQQHGFMHAGAMTTALDTAAGFAAYSVMPADAGVLTIELKVSLMRPARAPRFRIVGRVLKPGRSVTFTEAVAYGLDNDAEVEVARLTASMMVVSGRDEVTG